MPKRRLPPMPREAGVSAKSLRRGREKEMFAAIHQDDVDAVSRRLCLRGSGARDTINVRADATVGEENRRSLIRLAGGMGSLKVARLLLSLGAEPKTAESWNGSPKSTCTVCFTHGAGHWDFLQLCFDAGMSPAPCSCFDGDSFLSHSPAWGSGSTRRRGRVPGYHNVSPGNQVSPTFVHGESLPPQAEADDQSSRTQVSPSPRSPIQRLLGFDECMNIRPSSRDGAGAATDAASWQPSQPPSSPKGLRPVTAVQAAWSLNIALDAEAPATHVKRGSRPDELKTAAPPVWNFHPSILSHSLFSEDKEMMLTGMRLWLRNGEPATPPDRKELARLQGGVIGVAFITLEEDRRVAATRLLLRAGALTNAALVAVLHSLRSAPILKHRFGKGTEALLERMRREAGPPRLTLLSAAAVRGDAKLGRLARRDASFGGALPRHLAELVALEGDDRVDLGL